MKEENIEEGFAQQQEQPEPQADDVKDTTEEGDGEIAVEAADNADGEEEGNLEPIDIALHKIEELTTKYKYLAAEFDNYRKRTIKERADLILNGGEKTITALLPVIDDMERALANGLKTDDPEVLREGMSLIYQKTMKTLEAMGVTKIDTADADFNTDVHEAVAMVPGMGDDKKGKVIDCLATGYKLNDKVIRHAKVAVGQ